MKRLWLKQEGLTAKTFSGGTGDARFKVQAVLEIDVALDELFIRPSMLRWRIAHDHFKQRMQSFTFFP